MQNNTNLSKTKPAFRTSGSVTGNFGAGKRTAGSVLNDVPANSRDTLGNFPTEDEYYYRLRNAISLGASGRTLAFIQDELKRIGRRRNVSNSLPNPIGPHCSVTNHFVSSYQ